MNLGRGRHPVPNRPRACASGGRLRTRRRAEPFHGPVAGLGLVCAGTQ